MPSPLGTVINYLLIACPETIKTNLTIPDKDFELIAGENFIKIFVERSNYRPEKTFAGGNPSQYTRIFGSPQLALTSYVREIEVTVADERAVLYDALEAIRVQSISLDLQSQTPVKIIDYVLPESADRIAAIAASTPVVPVIASTTRFGLIKSVTPNGGTVGDSPTNSWIVGGCTFRYEEILLRY